MCVVRVCKHVGPQNNNYVCIVHICFHLEFICYLFTISICIICAVQIVYLLPSLSVFQFERAL